MLVDIPYEAVSKIVIDELKDSLQNLEADYETRKNGGITAGVFNANRQVDLKKIEKTMRALKRVLYYYGEKLDE